MKVEEFIEELKDLNQEAEIIFYDWQRGTFMDVSSIWGEGNIVQISIGEKWHGN